MNTYKAFWRGKQIDVIAATSFKAQEIAAWQFGAKKRHEVTVVLLAVGERVIVHSTAEI